MVENDARLISTSVARILVNMVESAMICSTTTLARACQDIRDETVRSTLTIAYRILAKMLEHALMALTTTNVFARFHLLDVIVKQRWILVCRMAARMELAARQVQIIKTFSARVQSVSPDDIAMRTSTSVNSLHLVAMVQLARTSKDLISASALKATREKIVRSTLTTVHHRPVTTAELVSMELVITLACVMMASKASTVRPTSMSASPSLVSTVQHANSTSTRTLAHAHSASQASTVKSTMKIARRRHV